MLLPAALVEAHVTRRKQGRRRRRSDRFTLIFFWSTFVFFTISGSRRSYYILPILPPDAMLIARLLASPWERLSDWGRRLLIVGYGVFVVRCLAGSCCWFLPPPFFPVRWRNCPPLPSACSSRCGRSCSQASFIRFADSARACRSFDGSHRLLRDGLTFSSSRCPSRRRIAARNRSVYQTLNRWIADSCHARALQDRRSAVLSESAKPLAEFDILEDLTSAITRKIDG